MSSGGACFVEVFLDFTWLGSVDLYASIDNIKLSVILLALRALCIL